MPYRTHLSWVRSDRRNYLCFVARNRGPFSRILLLTSKTPISIHPSPVHDTVKDFIGRANESVIKPPSLVQEGATCMRAVYSLLVHDAAPGRCLHPGPLLLREDFWVFALVWSLKNPHGWDYIGLYLGGEMKLTPRRNGRSGLSNRES
jgi:hypothetical protein